MEYEIIYEKSSDGWSAYVPELPGCTSVGADRAEIENNIKEAIELHLELLHGQEHWKELTVVVPINKIGISLSHKHKIEHLGSTFNKPYCTLHPYRPINKTGEFTGLAINMTSNFGTSKPAAKISKLHIFSDYYNYGLEYWTLGN